MILEAIIIGCVARMLVRSDGDSSSGSSSEDSERSSSGCSDDVPWGGFGDNDRTPSPPSEYNISEEAGDAFRSVFGDDNVSSSPD